MSHCAPVNTAVVIQIGFFPLRLPDIVYEQFSIVHQLFSFGFMQAAYTGSMIRKRDCRHQLSMATTVERGMKYVQLLYAVPVGQRFSESKTCASGGAKLFFGRHLPKSYFFFNFRKRFFYFLLSTIIDRHTSINNTIINVLVTL